MVTAGSNLDKLLGSAGLQLEEPLEVVAVVVGANGVRDRAADLRETRKPGWWASQEFLRLKGQQID